MLDRSFFETIDNELKAYWLGFLMADGYVHLKDKQTKPIGRLEICIHPKDIELLHMFKQHIGSNHKIKHRFKVREHKQNRNSVVLRIKSLKLCIDLSYHGCTQKKSKTLRYPNIPTYLDRHFVRGYFDGDGCICQKSTGYWETTISSGSRAFVGELLEKLKVNKVECTTFKGGTSLQVLRVRSRGMSAFSQFMYDDTNVFLDRKKNKFDEYLST